MLEVIVGIVFMVVRLLWTPFQVFSALNSYKEAKAILYLFEISAYIGIGVFLVNSRLDKKMGHWSLLVSLLLNNSILATFMFYDYIRILNFYPYALSGRLVSSFHPGQCPSRSCLWGSCSC